MPQHQRSGIPRGPLQQLAILLQIVLLAPNNTFKWMQPLIIKTRTEARELSCPRGTGKLHQSHTRKGRMNVIWSQLDLICVCCKQYPPWSVVGLMSLTQHYQHCLSSYHHRLNQGNYKACCTVDIKGISSTEYMQIKQRKWCNNHNDLFS